MNFFQKLVKILTPKKTQELIAARIELDKEQETAWKLFRSEMEKESKELSEAIHKAQQSNKK